jgi:hypothetical protein
MGLFQFLPAVEELGWASRAAMGERRPIVTTAIRATVPLRFIIVLRGWTHHTAW